MHLKHSLYDSAPIITNPSSRDMFIKKPCTNFHENPTDVLATDTGSHTDERKLSAQKGGGSFFLFRKDRANNGADTAHVLIFLSRVM